MNWKQLAAAAVLTTAVAAPALTQQALAQDPHARSAAVRHHGHVYYRDSTGFWPGDVAAGVVGGAIGTAGAIATAPFRGGFGCEPGTTYIGEDGLRHRCW
jgi:hypothetical protein